MESMGCEVKELPREMKIKNGLLIFDDRVICLAPIEENYGFTIESKSYTKTMKIFFYGLWNMAKPWPQTEIT